MAVIGYKAETKDERRKERRRDREVVRGQEGRAWAALRIFRALGAVMCPFSDSRFLVRKVGGVNGGWEN